ncbi:hypothetical protein CHELA41_20361 [Hyphomicrobiales bacterium]|nr:hypothetical protein CHELA41_20361 [Hyphomicrobiales bacterium]
MHRPALLGQILCTVCFVAAKRTCNNTDKQLWGLSTPETIAEAVGTASRGDGGTWEIPRFRPAAPLAVGLPWRETREGWACRV